MTKKQKRAKKERKMQTSKKTHANIDMHIDVCIYTNLHI